MKVNALLMNEKDNVVTCVHGAAKGEQVTYRCGERFLSVTAEEDIPPCHKIAVRPIAAGEAVVKYGEAIGGADGAIPAGSWVSERNISSQPRDYESELLPE